VPTHGYLHFDNPGGGPAANPRDGFTSIKPYENNQMAINPEVAVCLWFHSQAEEAAEFYTSLIPNSEIKSISRPAKGQTALMVTFTLGGMPFQALNGGPQYKHSEATSISVTTKDQEKTDRLWDAFSGMSFGLCSKCPSCNAYRIIFLSLFILIASLVTNAQDEFRPILDSLAVCSYYNNNLDFRENPLSSKQTLELFYIVENMPSPKVPISDIENLLGKSIRLNEHEMSLSGEIYIQCVVNCKGRAGDFQIIHCPSELVNIGCQVLNVFREKINTWEPGKQRGNNVDTMIKLQLKFRQGRLKVTAPHY
jgi:hypothetical protein